MTEMNDKMLKEFFGTHKQEIADNGFSRRVMRNLPDRSLKLSKRLTAFCGTIAVILFFALDGLQVITTALRETFISMVQYGSNNLEPKSLLIAATVLLFFGISRIVAAD